MAKVGGKRAGAGRKKGSKNRKTSEIAMKAAGEGITPLEYMLKVMRDKNADTSRRDDMAKAAASFVHPRLSATDHSGELGLKHRHELSPELKELVLNVIGSGQK